MKKKDIIINSMQKSGYMVVSNDVAFCPTSGFVVKLPQNGCALEEFLCFSPIKKDKPQTEKLYVMKKYSDKFAKITEVMNVNNCKYVIYDKMKWNEEDTLITCSPGECLPEQAFNYIYKESEVELCQ